MLKLIKQNFVTTWNNIIVATPLILFITLLRLYYDYANKISSGLFDHIFSVITLFVIVCGFFSAWLYLVKKAYAMSKKVYLFDKDRNKDLINLFISLYKGLGKLFMPIIGMLSLLIIINLLLFTVNAYIVTTIPKLYVYKYYLHIGSVILVAYLSLYWLPEIVYSEKNALFALYNSVIKLITNFLESFILFCWIIFLLLILFLLYLLTTFHPIFSFILLLFLYYIIVYIVMLLFTYYEQRFIKNDIQT